MVPLATPREGRARIVVAALGLPGFLAFLALLLAAGCADAPTSYRAVDRLPSDTQPLRLTYSPGDDRAPAWSVAGDSVYYAAQDPDALPPGDGILVAVPGDGGSQRALLPSTTPDDGLRRWFTAPAISPAGDRLAYVQIPSLLDIFAAIDSVSCEDGRSHAPGIPLLTSVRVRVNALPDHAGAGPVAELALKLAGDSINYGGNDYILRDFPFQERFRDDGVLTFRPTWSADAHRVAFSDGLRILIWTLGQDSATAIPGTDDGVSAAWSPDGQWIAFTRLARGDSTALRCDYIGKGGLLLPALHVSYALTATTLVIVHADGSGLRELGPGEEPAWTPDGSALYVRRDGGLWRVALDGTATPLQAAGNAWEPAVSTAGDRIAFTRHDDTSPRRDIWVLDLP